MTQSSIQMSLGRMARLVMKLGSEEDEFTFPWFAHWVVQQVLR